MFCSNGNYHQQWSLVQYPQAIDLFKQEITTFFFFGKLSDRGRVTKTFPLLSCPLFCFIIHVQQSLDVLSRNIAWYVNFLLVEVVTTTRNWIFLIAPVDLVHNVNEWSTQLTINLLFSSVQTNSPIDDPILLSFIVLFI